MEKKRIWQDLREGDEYNKIYLILKVIINDKNILEQKYVVLVYFFGQPLFLNKIVYIKLKIINSFEEL